MLFKSALQWEDNQKKWETRLSALFVSIDPKNDGNITFEAFQEVIVLHYSSRF
jgi:hypothetical protein